MLDFSSLNSIHPIILALPLFGVGFLAFRILSRKIRAGSPTLAGLLRQMSDVLLPTSLLLVIALNIPLVIQNRWIVKSIQSLLGVEIIWIVISAFRSLFLSKNSSEESQSQGKIPVLFLDVLRLALVVLGGAFVVSVVWNHDLTHFLTTLGIGSIVLGLALQETLGHFFAGLAILFERPFKAGDWIKVLEHEGQVLEVNWRSVRLRDRDNIMVILPNSIVGRERIQNFSQPSNICGIKLPIGFSYQDRPNKVKRVLLDVLGTTPKVLKTPASLVRTKTFADFAVIYEIEFFINDYGSLLDIEEDIKTRIWYAAQRSGLTIPLPTKIIHKTEIPLPPAVDEKEKHRQFLGQVALFSSLTSDELTDLSNEAYLLHYGDHEVLVEQGATGDSLFVILNGAASVSLRDPQGSSSILKLLGPGDFFGEMALLTGEPRAATVYASGDVEVIVINKDAVKALLIRRPELLEKLAQSAESRRSHLEEAKKSIVTTEATTNSKERETVLVKKIRGFLGL